MPGDEDASGLGAETAAGSPVDVAALFESLRDEVRRSGGDAGSGNGAGETKTDEKVVDAEFEEVDKEKK